MPDPRSSTPAPPRTSTVLRPAADHTRDCPLESDTTPAPPAGCRALPPGGRARFLVGAPAVRARPPPRIAGTSRGGADPPPRPRRTPPGAPAPTLVPSPAAGSAVRRDLPPIPP